MDQLDKELLDLAASGMCRGEIAEELGVSPSLVSRRAKKLSVAIPNAHTLAHGYTPKTIRHQVQEMSPVDAVEHLLLFIEGAFPCQQTETLIKIASHGFNISESRILAVLFAARGKTVQKAVLFNSAIVSALDPNNPPDPKILDVQICKIRKKVREGYFGFSVTTAWGVGYACRAHLDFDYFGIFE